MNRKKIVKFAAWGIVAALVAWGVSAIAVYWVPMRLEYKKKINKHGGMKYDK